MSKANGKMNFKETYLAVLKKAKINNPGDHFEVITSTAKSVLAPSQKLLKWWKKKEELIKSGNGPKRRQRVNILGSLSIEFVDFRSKYNKEIKDSPEANKRITELIKISETQTVWLVCYEKEYPCHRFLLKDLIQTRLSLEKFNNSRFDRVEPKYGVRYTSISAPITNVDGTCARPECDNQRPPSKQKYCSGECAQLSFWERNWEGFRYIALIRDNFRCVKCGVFVYIQWYNNLYLMSSQAIKGLNPIDPNTANSDYDFVFLKLTKKYSTEYPAIFSKEWVSKIEVYKQGEYTLERDNGHYKSIPKEVKKANTDHIIPIFKGGHSLHLDNLQTLCEDCHKLKTKEDMSTEASRERREKKEARVLEIAEIKKDQTSLEDYYD